MNKKQKTSLYTVRDKIDTLRGDLGQCLAGVQDVYNTVTDQDDKMALERVVMVLEATDTAFSNLDGLLLTAIEGA